jgi:hypothetical protein
MQSVLLTISYNHLADFPLDLTCSPSIRPVSRTVNVIYPTRRTRAVGERSQQGPEEIMPPAPQHIKNECIRCLHVMMFFMSKAWQLDLDEIVCDFVQDHSHKLWFVRIVRYQSQADALAPAA